MKKIFLILVFSLLLTQDTFAQETGFTDAACAAAGGDCNSFWNSCEDNQTKLGVCIGAITNSACCKNNSVSNPNAQETEDGLGDGRMNIIGRTLCERPRASNGWGGVCRSNGIIGNIGATFTEIDPCNDFGDDAETLVGLCNPTGDGATASFCCVPRGTAITNPSREQVEGLLVTTDYCTSRMGGKCEDIDNPNFGSGARSIGIDIQDATCDTPNEIVVSLCVSNSFWSSDANDQRNGCCVPQDGPYCRQLQQESGGEDICRTQGAGGAATSIQYGDYQLLEQIPGSSNTSGELQPYLESVYKAGFVLIVLGAIFMIGVGGFTYMASAGNTAMISKGKGMIKDALIGLVVALLIWLILNIINPDLVNLQIDPLPGLSFDANNSGANAAADNTATDGAQGGGSCTPIPDSQLTVFPSEATAGEPERGTTETVQKFMAMRAAALQDNINLKVSDGYRSPEEQLAAWNQNGCSLVNGRARCRVRTAAIPCSLGGHGSNHTSGTAVDIRLDTGVYEWLTQNAGRFGFKNELPNDRPHWSPTGR